MVAGVNVTRSIAIRNTTCTPHHSLLHRLLQEEGPAPHRRTALGTSPDLTYLVVLLPDGARLDHR